MRATAKPEAAAPSQTSDPAELQASQQQPKLGAPAHLYEAVSTQRERVLGDFDTQRASILKAVADQREAALAPIRTVRARQAAQAAQGRAAMPGTAKAPTQQQLVAADIVLTLKAMVAEEVRAQLTVLLGSGDAGSDDRERLADPRSG